MKINHIERDLSKIKHLASIRENENIRFRTFLKGQDNAKVDKIVHRLHEEISKQIGCEVPFSLRVYLKRACAQN